MKLTTKQENFLKALILANTEYSFEKWSGDEFHSKAEPGGVETGKFKPYNNATIRSLIKKGLITAKACHWSQYGGVQAWKQIWVTDKARILMKDKQIIQENICYFLNQS